MEVQRCIHDVRGLIQGVDLPHRRLEMTRGGTVVRAAQEGFDCRTQSLRGEFAPGDHDACSLRGDAGGDSRLVIAKRDAHEGHAFGERFERGVETGVGDDGGGALHDIELRGVANDERITWQRAEGCRIEAAAERDHELKIETDACLGDLAKDVLCAVLQCTERGVHEGGGH